MQYSFSSKYLVVINENTYDSIYKYEKCKFDQQFFFFQAKKIFIAKSKVYETTRFLGALDNSDFTGNTILQIRFYFRT